jgi:DNA-binding YbaB/EbfC family protein
MFDQLKNLSELPKILGKAREVQERMQRMQEELGRRTVEGEAGAGMVRVTMNGRMEVVRVRIDYARLGVLNDAGKLPMSAGDFEMLEDLIAAASRAAQEKAGELVRSEMARIADEVGVPPGLMQGQLPG